MKRSFVFYLIASTIFTNSLPSQANLEKQYNTTSKCIAKYQGYSGSTKAQWHFCIYGNGSIYKFNNFDTSYASGRLVGYLGKQYSTNEGYYSVNLGLGTTSPSVRSVIRQYKQIENGGKLVEYECLGYGSCQTKVTQTVYPPYYQ
jgi:hypothetical protein